MSTPTHFKGPVEFESTVTLGEDFLVGLYGENAVWTGDHTFEGAADLSAATVTLAAGEIDSADIAAGAVDEVHLAVTRCRTVAEDAALTLAATDSAIALLLSTTGTKAATMTATHNGHRIRIVLQARAAGEYTLAATYAGAGTTVTLNAAGEGVEIMRVGGAWIVLELIGGATIA